MDWNNIKKQMEEKKREGSPKSMGDGSGKIRKCNRPYYVKNKILLGLLKEFENYYTEKIRENNLPVRIGLAKPENNILLQCSPLCGPLEELESGLRMSHAARPPES